MKTADEILAFYKQAFNDIACYYIDKVSKAEDESYLNCEDMEDETDC